MSTVVHPIAVLALLASMSVCEAKDKILEVASDEGDAVAIVDVVCTPTTSNEYDCKLFGTYITTNSEKLHGYGGFGGNVNGPNKCLVEIGLSRATYVATNDGTLVYREGPGGACATTLTQSIDFKKGTYSFRSAPGQTSGDFCKAQQIDAHEYTASEFQSQAHRISCTGMEAVPSLWMP
jgi:hypothetical protein